MDARDRRVVAALAAVLLFGLILRVAYILGQRGDLLFDHPAVDEETYVAMGRAFAEGRVPDPRPWFQPPGLVYALGVVFWIAGPGLLAARMVQAVLSTASCALTFVVARRLFSAPIALGAAFLCAVHGALVFETYELLPPTWMLASDLVAVWALLEARRRATPASALGAGAALGIAAIFGPTVLPFAAVAAWLLRRPLGIAAFIAGMAVPIAPVAWGNWQRGHEVVLVSTNGGINFYIGNNEQASDTLAIRPGPRWDDLVAEPGRHGVVGWGAASSYFTRKGLSFWREHPAAAAGGYVRKLYLYFDGPEIPRDTDLQAMRESSGLLRALVWRGPPWWPDGVVVPVALVGAALSWRDRRRLAVLYAFVALQALVVAAFFVTSRYRVPAIPVLAMFASSGVAGVVRAWRSPGPVLARVLPAAACVALAVPLNLATRESSVSYRAELDLFRGMVLTLHTGDRPGAVGYFRRATVEDPHDARAWWELGSTLDSLRRTDEAIDAWRRASEADPWDVRPARRLSSVLAGRGDVEGAIGVLEGSIASRARDDAYYAPDHLALAMLFARRGLYDRALDEVLAARRVSPGWFARNIGAFSRDVLATPGLDDEGFRRALVAAARTQAPAGP